MMEPPVKPGRFTRNFGGPFDDRVEDFALEVIPANDVFLHFGEGSIVDRDLSVFHANRGSRVRRIHGLTRLQRPDLHPKIPPVLPIRRPCSSTTTRSKFGAPRPSSANIPAGC
jgi:hypothetical protein